MATQRKAGAWSCAVLLPGQVVGGKDDEPAIAFHDGQRQVRRQETPREQRGTRQASPAISRSPGVRLTGRRNWVFEPVTPRFSGAVLPWRVAAARSLVRHLAASIVAQGRSPSLEVYLRWLPVWLPRIRSSGIIRATHL
jgi:hypothetical protein